MDGGLTGVTRQNVSDVRGYTVQPRDADIDAIVAIETAGSADDAWQAAPFSAG
jgi:hypothetical protein